MFNDWEGGFVDFEKTTETTMATIAMIVPIIHCQVLFFIQSGIKPLFFRVCLGIVPFVNKLTEIIWGIKDQETRLSPWV